MLLGIMAVFHTKVRHIAQIQAGFWVSRSRTRDDLAQDRGLGRISVKDQGGVSGDIPLRARCWYLLLLRHITGSWARSLFTHVPCGCSREDVCLENDKQLGTRKVRVSGLDRSCPGQHSGVTSDTLCHLVARDGNRLDDSTY